MIQQLKSLEINNPSNWRENAVCSAHTSSTIRTSLSAVAMTTSKIKEFAPAIQGLSILGGVCGFAAGSGTVYHHLKKGKQAFNCKDAEGVIHNGLRSLSAFCYAGVSSILTANGIMGLMSKAVPATLGTAFIGFGFGLYVPLLLFGVNGLKKGHDFCSDLEKIEKTGTIATLNWIKNQITLSVNESQLPQQEKEKLLKKKQNEFSLRTSEECLKTILQKIEHKSINDLQYEEQLNIIETVKKANFKQKVRYRIVTIISLIGLATFLSILFTAGITTPILFALGFLFWLSLDASRLHNKIGDKFWDWSHKPKSINQSISYGTG